MVCRMAPGAALALELIVDCAAQNEAALSVKKLAHVTISAV